MTENNLFLYESGSPEKPAILFLHASPLSGRMWQPQLAALTEFHCLAPDLPEHGRSSEIRPFDMDDTVARLSRLVRTSTPKGCAHVVGLSFGGVVAQAMMTQAPEVVEHVILSGTAARGGKTFQTILKWYLAANKPVLKIIPMSWIAALFCLQFGIPTQYKQMMAEDLQKLGMDALTSFILKTYANIVTPPKFHAPVLVVIGSKETIAARIMARRLIHQMPDARGVVAPGGTLVWNLQKPELFNSLVRAWLADQPLPQGFMPLS